MSEFVTCNPWGLRACLLRGSNRGNDTPSPPSCPLFPSPALQAFGDTAPSEQTSHQAYWEARSKLPTKTSPAGHPGPPGRSQQRTHEPSPAVASDARPGPPARPCGRAVSKHTRTGWCTRGVAGAGEQGF